MQMKIKIAAAVTCAVVAVGLAAAETNHDGATGFQTNGVVHVVGRGDTLCGIARKYGMSVERLKMINGLEENTIYPGNLLFLSDDIKQIVDVFHERGVSLLSRKADDWLMGASLYDIKVKWCDLNKILDELNRMAGRLQMSNACLASVAGVERSLKARFFDLLCEWRTANANGDAQKMDLQERLREVADLGKACENLRLPRGSHVGNNWGEGLWEDVLEYWLLDGEDRKSFEIVGDMKGRIGKYSLAFRTGLAKSEKFIERDLSNGHETFVLFKVQRAFSMADGFVYVKVAAGTPDYIPGFCASERAFTWVVKVDQRGAIVQSLPVPLESGTWSNLLWADAM